MLLLPKKPKFLKSFASKKAATCFFKKQNKLKFSCVGLIAKESGFIPNFQIDAMRLFLRRFLKKKGQLFFSYISR
jgi:ribosomal protein L16/L10AE